MTERREPLSQPSTRHGKRRPTSRFGEPAHSIAAGELGLGGPAERSFFPLGLAPYPAALFFSGLAVPVSK